MEITEYIKYPRIPLVNLGHNDIFRNVYVFEKLDGANTQIRNNNGLIIPGSRGKPITSGTLERTWKLSLFNWVHSIPQLQEIPESWVIFGEWVAGKWESPHAIQYDRSVVNHFYLIDLIDLTSQKNILPYEYTIELLSKKDLVSEDKIRITPFLKGTFSTGEILQWAQQSHFYDGPMEGVVIKDYNCQAFFKYLLPPFEEVRSKRGLSQDERYITQRRIEKIISLILDEGQTPTLEIMVRNLARNIQEEHDITIPKATIEAKLKRTGVHFLSQS
ncbi:MAG: RNA ligase family protein [Nanoarchaeota archaeon]